MATRFYRSIFFILGMFVVSSCGGNTSGLPTTTASLSSPTDLKTLLVRGYVKPACGLPKVGSYICTSYVLTDSGKQVLGDRRRTNANRRAQDAPPAGWYGPADLRSAYNITDTSGGAGRVVALVEAGNTPALESDLARYRDYYGLPACTTSNGCLRIVNQNGTTSLPSTEFDWSDTETPLDADMVSAMCPRCGILVVEANSESFADIETAENTAANMHPFAISNSFSATELQGANAAAFNHPGVAIFASAGDGGYATGPKTPAAFSTVIAVGGTTLLRDSSGVRGWSETAWSGSEGACSLYVAKPSWQTDTGCAMRTSADIAFSADPTARVVTYDRGGWDGLSGTSVGAPAIAALYALAGCAQSTGSFLYTYASHLFDVSSGSTDSCLSGWEEYCYNQSGNYAWNGHGGGGNNGASGSCTPSYACNAGVGYDAPTGNGTPNGLSAFQAPCATPAITPPPACTAASSSTPNPHPTQSSVVNPCTS